jgi:hypothetical protein
LEYFKACLKIDILNRDSRDYIRIEIFFDEWFLDQLLRPEILRTSAFSI